jgi:argininosuccinate synthase
MYIMKTAVLAYSGGLDTSVGIPLLSGGCACDQAITAVADRSALHKYAKHYTQNIIRNQLRWN